MLRLRSFCLGLYIYTILVILWGAWVRISKSGDGCGESWPLCDGKILPSTESLASLIEFSHRLTTGIFGILVIVLLIWVYRRYSDNLPLKKMALWSFIFTITEALLGAALVKLGLVVDDDSFARLIVMAFHQINSLLLSGFIGLCIIFSRPPLNLPSLHLPSARLPAWTRNKTWIASLYLLLAATGAIASLSVTLFPSESLIEGMRADFSGDSHWLVRWRTFHPLVAILLGSGLIYFLSLQGFKSKFDKNLKELIVIFSIALLFGASTLLFLSPMWMKLTHLTLAHVLWLYLLRYLVYVRT